MGVVEWFGGDAVICGRRKIDGRRWEGYGPGMPGPYGVAKGKQVLAGSGTAGMNPSPTIKEERSPSPLLIYITHFLWYILSSSS